MDSQLEYGKKKEREKGRREGERVGWLVPFQETVSAFSVHFQKFV